MLCRLQGVFFIMGFNRFEMSVLYRLFFLFCISLFVFVSCKKDRSLTDSEEILEAGFLYYNPQSKAFSDSIILIHSSALLLPVNESHPYYEGPVFKSHVTMNKDGVEKVVRNSFFIKWVVYDLDKNEISKIDSNLDVNLSDQGVGKYRLAQYIFKNEEYSKSIQSAVDSAAKTVEITNLKQIDSIAIDTLLLTGPFLKQGFDKDREFDAKVSFYKTEEDFTQGVEPLFETDVLKSLKLGMENVKFKGVSDIYLPTFDTQTLKDGFYLELTYIQDGKSFKILNNTYGLMFKDYKTGYISSDLSSLQEERKLRFGSMTLRINSSFKFMR